MSSDKPSFELRMFAVSTMFLCGVIGIIANTIVFLTIFRKFKEASGFLRICLVKSIANNIICVGFLVWPVPVTLLNYYFLPEWFNVFMGQFVGWFAWTLAPLTQILLTCSRTIAVYFPFYYSKHYPINPVTIGIIVCVSTSVSVTIIGFRDGCHFTFVLDVIGWTPEVAPCAELLTKLFTYWTFIMVFVSNTFNVATFFRLVADTKKVTVSSSEASNRRSKHRRMLFQSVCQDCLIAIDTFNTTVAWSYCSSLLYQYLVLSFSMVFVRMLEGLIMLIVNDRIRKGAQLMLNQKKSKTKKEMKSNSNAYSITKKNDYKLFQPVSQSYRFSY